MRRKAGTYHKPKKIMRSTLFIKIKADYYKNVFENTSMWTKKVMT